MAEDACAHIEAITTVKRPKRRGMRRMREKRVIVDSFANMPRVWRDTLLR
jgi:hypothetical protein